MDTLDYGMVNNSCSVGLEMLQRREEIRCEVIYDQQAKHKVR